MPETEMASTVQVKLSLWQALRVLFGAGITMRIAHRGKVDKVIVFVGGETMGKVVAD